MDTPDAPSSLRACLRELRSAGLIDSYERVDLAAWTCLRVGGVSDLLIRCRSLEGVREILDLLASHGLFWVTMGSGSRLVPPDRPLRVPVLTLGGALGDWQLLEGAVEAGGAVGLPQLQRSMDGAGVEGAPRLFGTTGTVGGAIEDALACPDAVLDPGDWVEVTSPGREPVRHTELGAGGLQSLHRSVVTKVKLHLGAHLKPPAGRDERLAASARVVFPLFTAPRGEAVADLLRTAGCADLFHGGARLDASDPNTLRTTRSATARDVRALCREVRHRVRQRCGLELVPRLRFIDEWGRELDE